MLATGTTWEQFTWDENENGSASHAWSAHPIYHFTNIVTGVQQLASGWREVLIKPDFTLNIQWAESTIPTPLGLLKVKWQKENHHYSLSIYLPQSMHAKIQLPNDKIEQINGENSILEYQGILA